MNFAVSLVTVIIIDKTDRQDLQANFEDDYKAIEGNVQSLKDTKKLLTDIDLWLR